MKKFTTLCLSLSLPLVLAACDRNCGAIDYLFGGCNESSGNTGGSQGGGGGNAGTVGGTQGGGGGTAGTVGGNQGGGGGTAGTVGGAQGGGGNPNAAAATAGSSAVTCSTHCNSNDAKCYNIAKCEADKAATSSAAAKSKRNKED